MLHAHATCNLQPSRRSLLDLGLRARRRPQDSPASVGAGPVGPGGAAATSRLRADRSLCGSAGVAAGRDDALFRDGDACPRLEPIRLRTLRANAAAAAAPRACCCVTHTHTHTSFPPLACVACRKSTSMHGCEHSARPLTNARLDPTGGPRGVTARSRPCSCPGGCLRSTSS